MDYTFYKVICNPLKFHSVFFDPTHWHIFVQLCGATSVVLNGMFAPERSLQSSIQVHSFLRSCDVFSAFPRAGRILTRCHFRGHCALSVLVFAPATGGILRARSQITSIVMRPFSTKFYPLSLSSRSIFFSDLDAPRCVFPTFSTFDLNPSSHSISPVSEGVPSPHSPLPHTLTHTHTQAHTHPHHDTPLA